MNDKCYEGKNDVFSVDVPTTEINFTTYYLRDKTTETNVGATWSSKKECYHSADTSEWLKGTQEIYDNFDAYACISNTATFETYGGKLINDGDEISKTTFKINNISLIWAEKDNTDFLGWTTTENDCKNPIKTGPTVEDPDSDDRTWVDGDTTYYACYGETTETKYTVTFNLNGGDTLYKNGTKTSKNTEELAIVYYKSYTASKTGSTFNGWSTNKNCTNVNGEGTLSITKKTTLYACYKSNDSGGIGGGDDDNIDENVGTGSLLYITYILGISSLVFIIYYIYKIKVKTHNSI